MEQPEQSRRTREERDEYYRSIVRNYTMMSDTFMRNVLKDTACAEYVLQVIMGRKDLRIVDLTVQKDYKNLQGHSAALDCVAEDSEGRQFDVEVQQESEGALPKRARYYSGLLDMNTLNPGSEQEKLPETYMILITRDDVLGYHLPICHIERRVEENGALFGDKAHIIYVNSSIQNDTALGRLMHDFHCRDASERYSPVLAVRVRNLKETPEEVENMCREMKKIREDGLEEGIELGREEGLELGREEGRETTREENALRMLKDHMSYELAAEYTGLSLDRVSTLAEGMTS